MAGRALSPAAHVARWLLAPLAVVASSAISAQPYGGNQLVCSDIEQRFISEQRQLNSRRLDFLLFDAAERGCIDLMERFIQLGASIEARDRSGNTALLIASRAGEGEAVTLLLARGSKVDHRNLAGSTALLQATMMNRRKTVKALLAAGGDANARNTRGITPLTAAAYNGSDRIVEMLLAAGADPANVDETGKGALVYAAGKGFTAIVAVLLDAGIDVDTRDAHDLTALMWAAGHSNDVPVAEGLATVKLLLERGASIDLVDDRGRSALMTAADRDHAEIAAALIAAGAEARREDRAGMTAMDLAKSREMRLVLQEALDTTRSVAAQ